MQRWANLRDRRTPGVQPACRAPGSGDGRTYTVTYTATKASNNGDQAATVVVVPKTRKNNENLCCCRNASALRQLLPAGNNSCCIPSPQGGQRGNNSPA